jgi:hypothetical protein
MGLPGELRVERDMTREAYITILRRNWHLLPYEQLTRLVEMSPSRLAFALREDDFLFVKLGNLKPRCQVVNYGPQDEAAKARAEEIRRLVEDRFGPELGREGEPRFAFFERFARVPEGVKPVPVRRGEGPRFLYSYCGVFGDPLLAEGADDSYPDGLLARLAENGVNGVWLHVVLRQLAPGGPDFPEFGEGWEGRLANLRRLVERAGRFGIEVYLYMNEPRAMPEAFFEGRPGMGGVREGAYRTLCTSEPSVRTWLSRSLAHVFRDVPGLGGVFTITASENLTNCASHGQKGACPRCKDRSAAEILAEVNAAIERGVHEGRPDAKVIVWDWGWPGPDAIDLLPRDVWLMSVSEWSLPIERGGVRTTVGEYSLSSPGPGPRALSHWERAQRRGLKTIAKVQVNNTWELSVVPYLPVMDLVAEHAAGLARAKVDGVMLSWSLGGYPSPNLRVFERFAREPEASPDTVLDAIAADRFGAAHAPRVRAAWRAFSRAFREFPFDARVVYNAPQQYGPTNLLYDAPTGYHATMVGFPYDDLDGWRGPYPAEVFADQFRKLSEGWMEGVKDLADVPGESAAEDRRLARAAGLHFASVSNQARFVLARTAGRRDEMLRILDDEARLARELFDLTREDSRIGFEASNQYYYTPLDLVEKVINCEYLHRQLAGDR